MIIKNYTPHTITILDDNDLPTTFIESVGNIRIAEMVEIIETVPPGIKLKKKLYSKPDNLPHKVDGTIYIVSSVVCNICPEREDFYVPFEMKKSKGLSLGAKSLCRNPYFIS